MSEWRFKHKRDTDPSQTKTPPTEGHPTDTTTLDSRRSFLRGRKRSALLATAALVSPNVATAYGYETPTQDTPAGQLVKSKLDQHAAGGDLQVYDRAISSFNSYSDLGEVILSRVRPQGVKSIKVTVSGKNAHVGILNSDTESALLTPSPVIETTVNGQGVPVPYIDQIDNDSLLTNTRSAQLFRVNKIQDWMVRSRWHKLSSKEQFQEWQETEINAPVPTGEIRDAFGEDFISPLTRWEELDIELNKSIARRDIVLGLVAIQITKKWGQRNNADGERQGVSRTLYKLSRKKSGFINPDTKKYISYSYKEWSKFKYSDTLPEKNSAKTYSESYIQAARKASRSSK